VEEPNLGLATTRELLQEIQVRAEVSMAVGEYPEEMNSVVLITENLLDSLPKLMLDYRTVDNV
jgi:hypothetical protein